MATKRKRPNTVKVSTEVKELREIVETVRDFQDPHGFLTGILKSLPCEPPGMMPSEWAERTRYLTKTSSPFPGKFKWTRTPFWREVVDRLSPFDPAQKIAVMKGTQVGFTCAVLENAIGFGMACDPQPMAFISGDEKLIGRAKKTRIDPMIDNSGLRAKIRPDTLKKGIRRTGDADGMMEFSGGYLTLCGPNNESNFQGLSYRMLLLDEVDLYPPHLGRSGDTIKVIEGRADAFKNRKKMLYGSRPTTSFGFSDSEKDGEEEDKRKEEIGSRILDLYYAGDQRKYMVPCPHCREKQELVFFKGITHEGVEYGMMFDAEACRDGDYSSVKYQCRHCGKQFEEYYKPEIIQPEAGAEWAPTAKAKEPYYHSYHMSALYSLTVEWWEIVKEFLLSKGDPKKMQLFFNRYLGLPFEDRNGGVQIVKLSEREGGYPRNTLPPLKENPYTKRIEGPLFLTAACDVQTGQNGRLEVEINAWGRGFRNWSVDYRVIRGTVEDINDPCWAQLGEILNERWGNYQVERMVVDSSDGNMTTTVYEACRRYGGKQFGFGHAALMIPGKGQPVTARTRFYQRIVEMPGENFPLLEIYSDNYKNRIAAWLRQDWRPGESAPEGWSMFPSGYDREYFRQLTTEERIVKRVGKLAVVQWVQHGRNEAWDDFVYNTAAADFVIEDYSKNVLGLDTANPDEVWNYFEKQRLTP